MKFSFIKRFSLSSAVSQRSKASLLVVAMSGLLTTACSDYPSEGVVDTRSVREVAEVLEVTGNVYGVKSGGVQATQDLIHDSELMQSAHAAIWESTYKKLPVGEFVPRYIDQDKFSASIVLIQQAAQAKLEKKQASINAEASEVEVELNEYLAREQELRAKVKLYKEIAGDSEQEIAQLNKQKDELIAARNQVIDSALTAVNSIARANELETLSSNPLKRYSKIDVKDKNQTSCSPYKDRLAVDAISELGQCLYFRIPKPLMAHNKAVAYELKNVVLELNQVEQQLGKKGGWRTKPTGIYAKLKATKNAGQEAEQKAV